jgi:4-hydroxy-tetrahydrodipicolinate reductase
MPIRIAIHGAAGRMGQRLIALTAADQQLRVVAALESARHPKLGHDAGLLAGVGNLGVPLSEDAPGPVDVVIDFSVPTACESILVKCVERRWPLVVATTGLDARQKTLIQRAADAIPLLWSPSMSLAVNLAMKLSGIAAQALAGQGGGVDVEIIERHHRFKEDAPSGTALKFGEIIAGVMGQTKQAHGRQGRPGERPRDEIGYHAVRVGDNPGEHTIIFGMLGETLEIAVKASSRDCYAHGALAAAKFIAGKPPGLYGIEDVLGL